MSIYLKGDPGKGGRIDVLKLMQDITYGSSSTTDQNTTLDVPNGLTTIKESDKDKSLNKPQSPSSSSSSGTTSSQSKLMPRPLAATKNNPRRMSDTSVTKKSTPAKLRPASVSHSKIVPSKSPHSKK